MGYFILTVGSDGLSNTFRPIMNALGSRFGIQASLVDTYFLMGQMYGEGGLWVRPAAMWSELVERDGYRGPRFTPVEGD